MAQKSDRLGAGIISTGWVSGEYVKAFEKNPHTEVVAICSRDKARARAKADEHGLKNCTAYDSVEEMLKNPSLDLVAVCTPHHLHVEQGILCAQAGKHIVMEKPAALDYPSYQKLLKTVEKTKVKSIVSFVLRWNPLFETLKALLADNALGELFYSEVDYFHAVGPWYGQYAWNIKQEIAGSALLTAGCHAVDGLRWFTQKEAVEVMAYANTSKKNPLKYEYEPNSVTLVKFSDGTMGKVACSLECVMPYVFNIQLYGDRGTVRNNQLFSRKLPGQTSWATIPTVMPDSGDVTHHPFVGEINHFVECIQKDQESHANLADCARTHEICYASQMSARTGKPVSLPLSI